MWYIIFIFIFGFQQFDSDVTRCNFFVFVFLEVHWISWIFKLILK